MVSVVLCVTLASCVVWLSQYLLLRSRMSLNIMEGLVWKEIVSSVCFHLFSCSRLMSSSISLLSVFIWLRISCVGSCDLRCLRCWILCLMSRLNIGL